MNQSHLQTVFYLKKGNKIHIHKKRGIYTVDSVTQMGVMITCHMWKALADHKYTPLEFVPYRMIKCMAGGNHNPPGTVSMKLRLHTIRETGVFTN